MLNFIAGMRPSSSVSSSWHLAVSSQHLLGQARAYQAMGNLEEAQKSYSEAVNKAKTEHEKKPGDLQAKKAFDAIRNEFFSFLSGLQEPAVVSNVEEHRLTSPSPANKLDFVEKRSSLSELVLDQTAMPAKEKSKLVDYLFEKALSTLGSLEVSNKPSLFLVYAHHNPVHGQAEADTSKYLIEKLSKIQVNLYSDQTPMGQTYSSAPQDLKEASKLEDILTNQLCLLPTQLRDDVKPVNKIVMCCSEVLGSYLKWPNYKKFYQEIRRAYLKDSEQPGNSDIPEIREVVRKFSQEEKYKAGFHHVLTEMAFLQIRAEHLKDQHGIIPVSLTQDSYQHCLEDFISATTVRMEDIPRFEEQAKAGRESYPNQSRHWVLFKLIERVLASSDEAKTFLNKFWEGYSECISRLKDERSTLGELEFVKLVDGIFDDIRTALHSQLARDLPQIRMLHTEVLKKLSPPKLSSIELRSALYKHYQLSNLSIQRVSGDQVSLEDCYINLAIVESHAQREKDQDELKKQAAAFERLPSGERLSATNPNKIIALDTLFEPQKLRNGLTRDPKRILIQGRAGIGKTTLCKKLVYEYHHNGLWQDRFESVLWVRLRQLKTHLPKRLEDLLCNQYFSSHQNSQAQALSKAFHAHQDKALFILDGLDEVVGELNEGSPLREFLQTLLNQTHVVITSRPAGVDPYLLGQLDLELETIGFSPDDVQAYIQKFVPESNWITMSIRELERVKVIQAVVRRAKSR